MRKSNIKLNNRKIKIFSVLVILIPFLIGNVPIKGENSTFINIKNEFRVTEVDIEPYILKFASYFGGNGDDQGIAVTIDSEGYPWIGGSSYSSNVPIIGGFNTTPSDYDFLVMKLKKDGSEILYSTFITGTYADYLVDLVIDSQDNIWVVGQTYSDDIPVTPNAINSTYTNISYPGTPDAAIYKISGNDGSLLYGSYIGGGKVLVDSAAIDNNDNLWIAGKTDSDQYPTGGRTVDPTYNGGEYDVFLSKVSSTGNSILFSTFIGGPGNEKCGGIDIDSEGDVWVVGSTTSSSGKTSDFPVSADALEKVNNGGWDIFMTEYDYQDKYAVGYSSFLGGSEDDYGKSVQATLKSVVVIGESFSYSDYPLKNAFDSFYNLGGDIVVTKFSFKGIEISIDFSTYIGGDSLDVVYDSELDKNGDIWITGYTTSEDFPVISAYQSVFIPIHHNEDVVIIQLSSDGEMKMSTFLGGPQDDRGFGLTYDENLDKMWVIGQAQTGLPTKNAFKDTSEGPWDFFVVFYQPAQIPSEPRDLKGLISLDQKILLVWNIPEFTDYLPIKRYFIYRSMDISNFTLLNETLGTSYIDEDVSLGDTYNYKVTAINTMGESEYSNIITLKIPNIEFISPSENSSEDSSTNPASEETTTTEPGEQSSEITPTGELYILLGVLTLISFSKNKFKKQK